MGRGPGLTLTVYSFNIRLRLLLNLQNIETLSLQLLSFHVLSNSLSDIIIYLFTAIGLSPGGSGYFTCKQNMKLLTTRFKSGGLHEKHVVATWNVGNHLSIC